MSIYPHETGKRLTTARYTLRNEQNGLTVHDRAEHLFYFYEGIFMEDLADNSGQIPDKSLENLTDGNRERLTKNVQSDNPFNICWMISGTCNLDCLYCFAENKMADAGKNRCDEKETARQILRLKPMCITLTGGEPTLNPKLGEILSLVKGETSTILDTNGTTPQLAKLIPALKEAGTAVRLTVDILDDDVLGRVRPRIESGKKEGKTAEAEPQTAILKRNIEALLRAEIPVVIHSVLTRYTVGKLDETAEELIRLGVKRWHFYPVNWSMKCKDIYEEIKVGREEACNYADALAERYGNELKITCPRNDIGFRERSVLLIDSSGRFLVDTVHDGSRFIGKDPTHPQKDEILSEMNFELHKQAYLCNFW